MKQQQFTLEEYNLLCSKRFQMSSVKFLKKNNTVSILYPNNTYNEKLLEELGFLEEA